MSVCIFLSGVEVTTFAAAALFFGKFWKASRDRFFLYFASACALIALESLLLLFISATQQPLRTPDTDATAWIYLLRLVAFLLILTGVLGKNRRTGP